MDQSFVPPDFDVPMSFDDPGFHLEPLGPVHNERDHEAWMSSIDHIRSTPGMDWRDWPAPMTLEENLVDMEMHARHFEERVGFTYSILDSDDVIGCVYIYPSDKPGRRCPRPLVGARKPGGDGRGGVALPESLAGGGVAVRAASTTPRDRTPDSTKGQMHPATDGICTSVVDLRWVGSIDVP
jgi:hypothetical protein